MFVDFKLGVYQNSNETYSILSLPVFVSFSISLKKITKKSV